MEDDNVIRGNFGRKEISKPGLPVIERAVQAYLAVEELELSGADADSNGTTLTDWKLERSRAIAAADEEFGPDGPKQVWEEYLQRSKDRERAETEAMITGLYHDLESSHRFEVANIDEQITHLKHMRDNVAESYATKDLDLRIEELEERKRQLIEEAEESDEIEHAN